MAKLELCHLLGQWESLIRRTHLFADLGQDGVVFAVGEGAVDPCGDLGHLGFFHAASGHGGSADADAAAEGDLLGVEGDAVFVHGDRGLVEGFASDFAVEAFRAQIDEHEMVVGATADDAVAERGQSVGVPFHIETQDTYSIVKRVIPEGKTMCSLCSRLRRGILYRVAEELGCTKIALGHHRDDILQTLFLNMFFASKLKGMPPKLASDDGKNVVIRPLAYVNEKDLIAWAQVRQFPIIPCTLCGSQDGLQRQVVGDMLREWDKKFPGRLENMFTALQNVVPSHLMDRQLHDFAAITATGQANPQGDKAFDPDNFAPQPGAIRFVD